MELLQLKYFCDAAETENFSKTAEKYMVPPSNISQIIRRLEQELGVLLFERKGNRVLLNEDGRSFYESVKKSIFLLEDAKRKLEDSSPEVKGEIKLQVFTNRRLVVAAIKEFNREYPHVTFVLNHGFPSKENFDLVLADGLFHKEGFTRVQLLEEEIAVAMAKINPLAQKENLAVKDLAHERFIMMHESSSLFKLTNKICADAGFTPNVSINCDDPYYLRQYVAMNLGVAFVPMFSWRGQFSEQTTCKKIEGLTRTTYIYMPQKAYETQAVSLFLKFLTAEIDKKC